ncbi:type VI secretion system Vgr family protein [Vibrio sp. TBV020]|uniref:type VI secretion system Vgr family protein n=1 Tax=Vibrio sp. TBV020 TaxID=3137398 RepID=UPI0038CDBB2D
MTTLNFTISVDGLNSDAFVVREFQGTETLSHNQFENGKACNGYLYDVQLASRNPHINASDVVDCPVQLTIFLNGQASRRVHGIVRNFSKGDTGHHHTFYSLTIVPALELLSLRHNCRIFQSKSAPEIISILLQEMNIEDFAFTLQKEYHQREFCTQYRESDLEFLHRLAAEEGLNYSFVFQNGRHTVVFSDDSEALPSLPDPISYNALAGGITSEPYISNFEVAASVQVSHVELRDRYFKKPHYSLQQLISTRDESDQIEAYEHFDAPGRFKCDESGLKFANTRLEHLRRETHTAKGLSNAPTLQAGYKVDLQQHFDEAINRTWVIVSVHHSGSQPQALEEEAGSGATTYSNTFSTIPSQYNWQATPQLKPLIHGPMIATVVGPDNEEIYCDDNGRVKVQFPWDRYSNGDEHSSCWVRVSQAWAGSQYGTVAIPRVGHEVIVEFLNGDPDQPIITGRTYHVTNTTPYPLPKHKSKTVIRTETHQGEGFNELSFEDQSGQEEIYLHAQKDWDSEVKHDSTLHIKHDKHLIVKGDQFAHVHGSKHETIEGEKRTKVSKDQTLIVEGSLHLKTGSIWVNDSGSEIHVKAGNKVVIEAGSEITLKAAGSFLKVDPAGVHLVGAKVNLNSGGSAGSGSGYSGKLAELPATHTNKTVVNEIEKNTVTATKQADNANVVNELSQSAERDSIGKLGEQAQPSDSGASSSSTDAQNKPDDQDYIPFNFSG